MVYTLAYRCFKICSDWAKFHEELSFLKQAFLKNEYPLSFINNCFKTFVDKFFIKRPQLITVRKPCFCHCHTLVKFPYKLELSQGNLSKVC